MGSGDFPGLGVVEMEEGPGANAESSMMILISMVEREVPRKLKAKPPIKAWEMLWAERIPVRAVAACRRAENEGASGPWD